jgi:hypothetical protein
MSEWSNLRYPASPSAYTLIAIGSGGETLSSTTTRTPEIAAGSKRSIRA